MSVFVDPDLMKTLRRYGAFDVSACFNCGNCTAICPLAAEGEPFPRRFIRYGQVGMKQRLLAGRELWLCYYCAQCSETCPRQAEPGEYMAALRRFAIAAYDVTGLARLLHTSAVANVVFHVAVFAAIALFFATRAGEMDARQWRLFEFVPFELVHRVGLGVIVAVAVLGAANVAAMLGRMAAVNGLWGLVRAAGVRDLLAAAAATAGEVVAWGRYRQCNEEHDAAWYLRPWFVHASVVVGMLGLLAATVANYILDAVGLKQPGMWDTPAGLAVRLWGTAWGLVALYGATAAVWRRLARADRMASHSRASDWSFLLLLWLTVLTGFVVEAAVIVPSPTAVGYWMLLVHMALGMELVLVLPLTKFAHVIYRTLALFIHELAIRVETPAPSAAAAAAEAGQ